MRFRMLFVAALVACTLGLNGCSSDSPAAPTDPPPPPTAPPPPPPPTEPPPPPSTQPPPSSTVCDVGFCQTNNAAREHCEELFTLCAIANPNDLDSCVGAAVFSCRN